MGETAAPLALTVPIQYLRPDPLFDKEKPYFIESRAGKGIKQTNISTVTLMTKMHDTRQQMSQFDLERHGFEWIKHQWSSPLTDEADVDEYMQEMEKTLRQHLQATRVKCYDYTIRRTREKNAPREAGLGKKERRPIFGAHLDISRAGAIDRLRLHFPADEVESIVAKHWRVVNIWRPLNGPITRHPLAVCDSQTLADEDLVASDIVLPHTLLEAYDLWYNPQQKWHFLDKQANDEVLLMINYDSERNVRAAHCAFEDPRTPADAPDRHSIELRCMVFW